MEQNIAGLRFCHMKLPAILVLPYDKSGFIFYIYFLFLYESFGVNDAINYGTASISFYAVPVGVIACEISKLQGLFFPVSAFFFNLTKSYL